jgi:hypothetical protein
MATVENNSPVADTADQVGTQNSGALYVVATEKFLVLYLVTLGLYSLYWFYKNWSLYKRTSRDDIWPIPRAFFQIFFVHHLCEIVNGRIVRKGLAHRWSSSAVPTTYVLFLLFGSIFDRLAAKGIGSPVTDVLSLLSLPVTAWALWKIQLAINLASGDPSGESNSELTKWNLVWITLGTALWALVLIGLFG